MNHRAVRQPNGPPPASLNVKSYPNDTWPAFLLLLVDLLVGCVVAPFTPIGPLTSLTALVLLAGVFWALNLRNLRKRFIGSPLKEVDSRFYASIRSSCPDVDALRIRLVVTENLFDKNAMTFGFSRNLVIVLGGGLRVLFRRSPASAIAIVEHEMGHIQNQDVTITLVARAMVRAYLLLACVPALYAISRVALHLFATSDEHLPLNLSANVIPFAKALLFSPVLPFAAFSWAMYRRIVRVREYHADARVSEVGSLASILKSGAELEDRLQWISLKGFFRLHPTFTSRLSLVADIRPWAKFDISYVFVLAFLMGVAEHMIPSGAEEGSRNDILGFFSYICIAVTSFWGLIIHASRVSTLQARLGRGFVRRIFSLVPALIACLLGERIGFEIALSIPILSWAIAHMVENYVIVSLSFIILAILIPVVTIGAWLNVRWPVQRISKALAAATSILGQALIFLSTMALLQIFPRIRSGLGRFGETFTNLSQSFPSSVSLLTAIVEIAALYIVFAGVFYWRAKKHRQTI